MASDTGDLPSTGGSITTSAPNATVGGVPNVLVAQALSATTEGSGDTAQSDASTADLAVTLLLLPGGITATVLSAHAEANCVDGAPQVSGSSVVTDLNVGGLPITVTGEPNQTVNLLGLGTVVINEQNSNVQNDTGSIDVNALHIDLPGIADVIVSATHADIACLCGA